MSLLDKKTKQKIHRIIFNPQDASPLNCLVDKDENFATHLDEIAKVIHSIQEEPFHRQTPLYSNLADHPNECTCAVQQYPRQTKDGFILEKRSSPQPLMLASLFTRIIHNTCLKNLSKGKSLGPYGIHNHILEALPNSLHDMMYLFFLQCYYQQAIPKDWN